MQQRLRKPLFVSVLASSLMLAACGDAQQQNGQTGQQQQQMTVGVVTVESRNVDLTTTLPGRASAFRVAEVRPQVNGILQSRLFEEGSMVEAGQQLYQINADMYEAELRLTLLARALLLNRVNHGFNVAKVYSKTKLLANRTLMKQRLLIYKPRHS